MGAEEVEGAPKAAQLPPASTSVMGAARSVESRQRRCGVIDVDPRGCRTGRRCQIEYGKHRGYCFV